LTAESIVHEINPFGTGANSTVLLVDTVENKPPLPQTHHRHRQHVVPLSASSASLESVDILQVEAVWLAFAAVIASLVLDAIWT
jgi:hypothetical protein